MSITINIGGRRRISVMATGDRLMPRCNSYSTILATLALPAHYPPAERERLAATAAVRDFSGRIACWQLASDDASRLVGGRQK